MRAPVTFVDTPKKARTAMDRWYREARKLPTASDTEFESDGSMTLMSLSWDSYKVRIVVEGYLVKDFFGEHLTDPKTKLVFQNYDADARTFRSERMNLDAAFHADTLVLGWLHDETLRNHGLKPQSMHFLHWPRKEYQNLFAYVPVGKRKPVILSPAECMYKLPQEALDAGADQEVLRELMINYNGDDSASTVALYWKHRRYLTEIGYWKNYLEIDRPFTLTLMQCQDRGVLIDLTRIATIRRLVGQRIMRSVHAFRALSGKPDINLNSGPQLHKLLIEELEWPIKTMVDPRTGKTVLDPMAMTKGGKTSKPRPKLGAESLHWWAEEHGFPLAQIKLNYNREVTKERTFLKGIIHGVSDDGRLRSRFNQIGADTGRISSRKQDKKIVITFTNRRGEVKLKEKKVKVGANLQNIPSRKEKDPDGIRGAFIAPSEHRITARGFVARELFNLVVADYSGFELCMMIYWTYAIRTKNKRMLGIMQKYKSPSACHAFTAINMYAPSTCRVETPQAEKAAKLGFKLKAGRLEKLGDIPMDHWKLAKILFPDQYTLSKNNNFNLLYGGSAQMMARLRGLNYRDRKVLRECEQQMEAWNDTYPEVVEYQHYMVQHGYEHGWVPTISGRRANVRDLLEDESQKGHGERKCMNTPCQGSAADIVKVAMNLIENDEELNSYTTKAKVESRKSRQFRDALKKAELALVPAVSLLFPVHDEIIVEAPVRIIDPVTQRVVYCMKQPFKEKLPFELDVEAKAAFDWLSAKG